MIPGDWWERAACAGKPLDLFFPGPNGSTETGRRICSRCPVRAECLTFALAAEGDTAAEHRAGIFGGTTAWERARIAQAPLSEPKTPGRKCEGCPWPARWRGIERHRSRGEDLCGPCRQTLRRIQAVEANVRAGRSDRHISTHTGAPASLIRAVRERLSA